MKAMSKRCMSIVIALFLLVGNLPYYVFANSLDEWTHRSPFPTGSTLNSIAYGNGTYVAVGNEGTIVTSNDGVNWTNRASGTANTLKGVTYAAGKFVAVGSGGTIVTSDDSVNWTSPANNDTAGLLGVAYGNDKYVATGNLGKIVTSADGTSWTSNSSSPAIGSTTLYGIAYINNLFVAVGSGGKIVSSGDGTNWTSQTSNISSILYGVAYGNGTYVAVGYDGTIVTSGNGTTWASQTSNTANHLNSVAYGDGKFVAVGDAGTIVNSSNGTNWTTSSANGVVSTLYGVTYANGIYVAVGIGGRVITSDDGTSWTIRGPFPTGYQLNGVAYGAGKFVAVGNGGTVVTSGDGTNWTSQTSGASTLYGVAYGNGTYVAVGIGGTIVTSGDGNNWTSQTSSTSNQLNSITYGAGKFVAVGNAGTIVTSSNGTDWTSPESNTTKSLNGVAYGVVNGNGMYVAVSASDTFVTSGDGVTWTSGTSGIPNFLYGISYGSGMYVAVGSNGAIVTSGNGTSWTSRTSGITSTLRGIAYENGTYVGVGVNGAVVTSDNGTDWTKPAHLPADTATLNGVVYGNNTFVAVGGGGRIIQSDPISAPPAVNGVNVTPDNATVVQGSSQQLTATVDAVGGAATTVNWTSSDASGKVAVDNTGNVTVSTDAAAGDYTITATSTADSSKKGTAKITVTLAPVYTIDAITNQTLAALVQGYESGDQENRVISINNTGTGDLTNLSAAISGTHLNDFEITQPSETLNSGSPATSLTIQLKDGLPAGTYTVTVTVSADNMSPVSFTVTQVVNLPNAPANPQNLAAAGGDRQVALSWSTVTGAAYYNIYMATASGQFGNEAMATVTSATYSVQNLNNGTPYYFVVKSGNAGGLSAASNEASATPATVPAAPTNVTAVAGNRQAIITFTAPTDTGGSEITSYEVTASSGNAVVIGTASPITVTGLTNGTSYTFTVKAVNAVGKSAASVASNAVIPRASSSGSGGSTPSQPSAPATPETASNGASILVNGKVENAGTATASKRNDRTVMTIVVDQQKLDDKLAAEGKGAIVTIPANVKSDIVIGELNGQTVKNMENKRAVVKIQANNATYALPAQQINIDAISDRIDASVSLQDIKIQIEIAAPTSDTVQVVEDAATKGAFTLVVPSVDFKVKALYGDTTVEVSKFTVYVERTIAIPDGVDPNKVTTGVAVEADGMVRHVPTQVKWIDGRYYAVINSLTNSSYAVVWHPLEFRDAATHWAKDAVNDMGSRMVIEGSGGGRFSPDRDITRAEFAAIIVRGLGLKPENGSTDFSDVKATDWYGGAINTAHAYGLIDGYNDVTFRPNDKITREQAMSIIAKAMKLTGLQGKLASQSAEETLRTFGDAAAAATWAKSGVADTVQAGIVSGRSADTLAPKAYMTRAETAATIQRLLKLSGLI